MILPRWIQLLVLVPFGASTQLFNHLSRAPNTVSEGPYYGIWVTSNTTSRRANCSNSLHPYGQIAKADLDVGGPHISPLNPRNPPS